VLFFESIARPLLVLHAISAAVLVATATHHLVWCRGYFRGEFGRYKGERRFAVIAACAFVSTFLIGNFLYPTYKVRVRAAYFDNPAAISDEARLRVDSNRLIKAPLDEKQTGALSPVARAFDIKEHWVALGCAASLVLLALSRRAHPKDHPRVLSLYLGLVIFVASTVWIGALVGLYTASVRAVGGVT
jgi:hypothetical protein